MRDRLVKKTLVFIILVLFVGTYVVSGLNIQLKNTTNPKSSGRGNTLYVGGNGPNNYTTIQGAINDANPGDTVFVYSGTYYENIGINKNGIKLIGENKDNTIIDGGNGNDNMITIFNSNIIYISGFSIRNGGWGLFIALTSNYITVINCNIYSNQGAGLGFDSSNNSIVSNCEIYSNGNGGCYVYDGGYNEISNCVFDSNDFYGIYLSYTNNSVISNCQISNSVSYGLSLEACSYNTISGNIFFNDGMYIYENSYDNIVYDNMVNDKPLVYLENEVNKVIDYAGQVILIGCDNITVKNQELSNTAVGIELWDADNCIISDNDINSNRMGGIMTLKSSNNNLIYHNNFFNNTGWNAFQDSCSNICNDSYPSGGNYWDDYYGRDYLNGPNQEIPGSDGIGDTPYEFDYYGVDWYPYMEPYGWLVDNEPPNEPTIKGPKSGNVGREYYYKFVATDPNENHVYFWIEWGDGNTTEEWIGPYASGATGSAKHIWNAQGSYQIKVKAKDTNGAETEWSEPLSITITKNKNRVINTPLLRFLEDHPNLFLILQKIIIRLGLQ